MTTEHTLTTRCLAIKGGEHADSCMHILGLDCVLCGKILRTCERSERGVNVCHKCLRSFVAEMLQHESEAEMESDDDD